MCYIVDRVHHWNLECEIFSWGRILFMNSVSFIYIYILEKAVAPHSSTLAWKNPMDGGAWWAAVHGVAKSRTWLSNFTVTFHFHALEKEIATHSSVLAWRIPGMAEPGGLLSMGSHRVRHDWSDLAAYIYTYIIIQMHYFFLSLVRCVSPGFFPIISELNLLAIFFCYPLCL